MAQGTLSLQLWLGTLLYLFCIAEELIEVNTYGKEYLMHKALEHTTLVHSYQNLLAHVGTKVVFVFVLLGLYAPGPALALTVWWAFMWVVRTLAYYHQHPWKRT